VLQGLHIQLKDKKVEGVHKVFRELKDLQVSRDSRVQQELWVHKEFAVYLDGLQIQVRRVLQVQQGSRDSLELQDHKGFKGFKD
jgi:hypothetical protein